MTDGRQEKTVRKGLLRVANSFQWPAAEEGRLVMPYGDYPAGRVEIKKGSFRHVIQRWNRDGALAVANALEEDKRLGAPGIPVYFGHPDVPELAQKYPDKAAKGWVVAIVANEHAAELEIEWNGERPRKREFAFFSPWFFGNLAGDDGTTAVMHVNDIGSVGLTNTPRIHAFRVPNESDLDEQPQTKEPHMDNELKTKLLEALGLPTDSDDEAILAAVQAAAKAAGELAEARTKAEAAEAEKTAAEKEKDETKAALANERAARISLLLDGAISEARITPAEKPRWEKLLGENFETNRIALANEAPKLKTAPAASALHFRKIDGSQAGDVRNIEVHPVQGAESLQIVPRHDLVVPGVEIVYEITSANQSGKRFRDVVVDNGGWNGTTGNAGNPEALGAAHFTIQLDGGSVRQLYQSVTTRLLPGCLPTSNSPTSDADCPFDPNSFQDWADFICDHIPELYWRIGPGIQIDITSISPSIPPTSGNIPLDHELLQGEIQPWMKDKIAEKRTIEITVDYTDDDGTEVKGRVFRVDFTATNAESGLYSFLESRQSAEDIPQNLAARLYAAVGRLYHEGRVTFVSDSVRDFYVNPSNANPGGPIHPGHLLNLTATNRSAWSSMRTPVQSVELDIATGRTTLAFGPPEHLGPQDLVQLAQANRKRASVRSLAAWSTAEAETEEPSVGGPGALSRAGRSMPGHTMKTVIGEDSGHGRVILDATDSTIAGGASTTVKPGLLVLRAGPGNNDPSLTLDPSAGGASNDLYTLDGLDVKVTGSLARGINVEVELYRKKVTIANGFVTAVETASSISDSDSVS